MVLWPVVRPLAGREVGVEERAVGEQRLGEQLERGKHDPFGVGAEPAGQFGEVEVLLACGQLEEHRSHGHLHEHASATFGVAARSDHAGANAVLDVADGVGDHLLDEVTGELSAGLEAAQHVPRQGGVLLHLGQLAEQGSRRMLGAEERRLVDPDLLEDVLVAGLTQPGAGAEVVHDQAGAHSGVGGDGAQRCVHAVGGVAADGRVSNPRLRCEVLRRSDR